MNIFGALRYRLGQVGQGNVDVSHHLSIYEEGADYLEDAAVESTDLHPPVDQESLEQGVGISRMGASEPADGIAQTDAVSGESDTSVARARLNDSVEDRAVVRQTSQSNTSNSANIFLKEQKIVGKAGHADSGVGRDVNSGISEAIKVFLGQAESYIQQKAWAKAIASCQEALDIDPNVANAYKLMGNAFQHMGQLTEAMGYYAKAIVIQPDLPEAYANLGTIYAKQKQWEEAAAYYQKAIHYNPSFTAAYRHLAKVYEKLERHQDRFHYLYSAITLAPEEATVAELWDVGQALSECKHTQEAIACFKKLLELDPNHRQANQALADLLEESGDWQAALTYYRKVLDLDQTPDVAQSVTQTIHPKPIKSSVHDNDKNLALPEAEGGAMSQRPQSSKRQTLLLSPATQSLPAATRSQNQGPTDGGKRLSGKSRNAMQYDGSTKTYVDIANAYAQQRNWPQAIAHYKEAIRLDPNVAAIYRDLARVLTQAGYRGQAAESWYRAMTLEPTWATAEQHFNLGNALLDQNQQGKAIVCYQRSLELDSDFEPALRRLSALQEENQTKTRSLPSQPIEPNLFSPEEKSDLLSQSIELKDRTINPHEAISNVTSESPPSHSSIVQSAGEHGQENDAVSLSFVANIVNHAESDFECVDTNNNSALPSDSGQPSTRHQELDSLAFIPSSEPLVTNETAIVDDSIVTSEPSEPIVLENVVQTADQQFEKGLYQESLVNYELALTVDNSNYHLILRKGECLLKLEHYEEARNALETHIELFGDNLWPMVCLGLVYFNQDKFEDAIPHFERSFSIDSTFAWNINLLGKSYQRISNYSESKKYFEIYIERLPEDAVGYLCLGDLEYEFDDFETAERNWLYCIELDSQSKWAYISLGNLYIKLDRDNEAKQIFLNALGVFPDDCDVLLALAGLHLSSQNYVEAKAILDKASELRPDKLDVKVRLLEVCCYLGELESAGVQFNELKDCEDLPHSFYQAASKFLSAVGRKDDAFHYAGQAILKEPQNTHTHNLFLQTVFKSKKHSEALALINDFLSKNEEVSELLLIKSSILEYLIESIPEANKLIDKVVGSNDESNIDLDIVQKRLRIKEDIFHSESSKFQPIKTQFFYCTDKGYALPTLVSIFSLHKYNRQKIGHTPVHVVSDSSTLEVMGSAYSELARNIGLNIKLVNIEELVTDINNHNLVTDYGVYSGGNTLSRTAYFRLYFAQHLTQFSDTERWLYIDSDTLVMDALDQVDQLDFSENPIAARREMDKPEIKRAIEAINLQHGRYYNSGVLAFNARHPELRSLAAEAIRISVEEGDRLLYHDQCALNIAFDGRITDLRPQFNDFYPPSDERDLDEMFIRDKSCIIHLIDRPKPWDSRNSHRSSILWFQTLLEMSKFMSDEHVFKLFNMLQNSI